MEPSVELVEMLRDYLGAIASGDGDKVASMLSRNVLLVGTDPEEWWQGHDTAAAAFRIQMEEMGGCFPIWPTDPVAYALGDAGWAADRPVFKSDEGEFSFRLTVFFAKEDGVWKVMLSHASIGVANADTMGQELTI